MQPQVGIEVHVEMNIIYFQNYNNLLAFKHKKKYM